MKTVACILFVVSMFACVVGADLSATDQYVCTQEDIDNQTCGDPGGGGPQAPVVETESYASSVIDAYAAAGYTAISRTRSFCTVSSERVFCGVRIDFESWYIDVSCETVGGSTHCSSTVHQTP